MSVLPCITFSGETDMIFRRARCLTASAETLVLALALALMLALDASAQDVETVALSGDQAPGADPGVVFSGFGVPALNAKGQTAFRGILTGTGVDSTNDLGFYSEGSGALAQVAREGDQAPDTGDGVVFRDLGNSVGKPLLNAVGQTAFRGFLSEDFSYLGIYSEGSGTLAQVARMKVDQAPGAGDGVVFSVFYGKGCPALNAAGQTAFLSSLAGTGVEPTNDHGIYSQGSGTLIQMARTGDQAPGAGDGVVFRALGSPVLNAAGQTAFEGSLTGAGVDFTNDNAIYSEASGTLAQLAREGDQAPDAGDGVVFSDFFGELALNDRGQAAFLSSLAGTGVDSTNDRGIYSEGSGALAQVVREGDQAPGAGAGVVFHRLGFPVLNIKGRIAFRGFLTGTGVDFANDSVIYREDNGALTQVAREGDQAPGAGVGVVFSVLGRPVLNAVGQTAFIGSLTGTGVDFTNNNGIYATDVDGQLIEIIRAGDPFDVNDDPLLEDFRTVETISFASNFNDPGQIGFRARFTDGSSGIFVSNLVSVAQPPSPQNEIFRLATGESLLPKTELKRVLGWKMVEAVSLPPSSGNLQILQEYKNGRGETIQLSAYEQPANFESLKNDSFFQRSLLTSSELGCFNGDGFTGTFRITHKLAFNDSDERYVAFTRRNYVILITSKIGLGDKCSGHEWGGVSGRRVASERDLVELAQVVDNHPSW